jgi:hypothetical protein
MSPIRRYKGKRHSPLIRLMKRKEVIVSVRTDHGDYRIPIAPKDINEKTAGGLRKLTR